MTDLEQFLKTEAGKGDYRDTGDFTVSPEMALDKIREFNFAGPYDWALALIQGCHLLKRRPSNLEIVGTRKGFEFNLLDVEQSVLDKLYPLLLSFDNTSPALEAFRRCIWGLLNSAKFKIRQGSTGILWDGKDLTQMTLGDSNRLDPLKQTWQISFEGVKKEEWHKHYSLRAQRLLDLKKAIEERAYLSAIPLLFDGRTFKTGPYLGGNSPCSPLIFAHGKAGSNTGRLVKQPWTEARLLYSKPHFCFEHKYPGLTIDYCCRLDQSSTDAAGSNPRLLTTPSRSSVRLVKDGVSIYEKLGSTSSPISCHITASCDSLRTDITGLSARVEDALAFLAELEQLYGRSIDSLALKLWKDINRAVSSKPFVIEQIGSHFARDEEEEHKRSFFSRFFLPKRSARGGGLGPLVLKAVKETGNFSL